MICVAFTPLKGSPFRKQFRREMAKLNLFVRRGKLNKKRVEDTINPIPPVTLIDPFESEWEVTTRELCAICSVIRVIEPKHIFEFGTFDGRTTLNMEYNATTDCKLTTIDLPAEEQCLPNGIVAGKRINEFRNPQRIEQLYGNTLTYDFTRFRNSIDFIFIDAGHNYECVRNDSDNAFDMLVEGKGVIIWHDYSLFPGVTKAVDEFAEKYSNHGRFFLFSGTTLACFWAKSAKKVEEMSSAFE